MVNLSLRGLAVEVNALLQAGLTQRMKLRKISQSPIKSPPGPDFKRALVTSRSKLTNRFKIVRILRITIKYFELKSYSKMIHNRRQFQKGNYYSKDFF